MKVGTKRSSGGSIMRTTVTVAAMLVALFAGAGYLPARGVFAQTLQTASRPVVHLHACADESVTSALTVPSGIAEADARISAKLTATTIRQQARSSRLSTSPKVSGGQNAAAEATTSSSGWKSAVVSWYGPGFYGQSMASGETLTKNSMIVAHRTLPFGTRIEFSYHGRTCIAVVMDRGPFTSGRTFDLGPGTAKALGFSGVGTVRFRIL